MRLIQTALLVGAIYAAHYAYHNLGESVQFFTARIPSEILNLF